MTWSRHSSKSRRTRRACAKNGAPLLDGVTDGLGYSTMFSFETCRAFRDDTIDFAVGSGADRNYNSDVTGPDARISPMRPEP